MPDTLRSNSAPSVPIAECSAVVRSMIGTPAYFAVHTVSVIQGSRDAAAEARFLAAAKRGLEPAWATVIERRRTAVK